jgi:hypothetical protein
MLNSILLLGSSYNKHKKISFFFTIALILNVIIVQLGQVKISFFLCNLSLLLIISFINKKITNKKIKFFSSICSILVWSIGIDIFCFYMFPLFTTNVNLWCYILKGILFNLKFVIYNAIILLSLNALEITFHFITSQILRRTSIKTSNI